MTVTVIRPGAHLALRQVKHFREPPLNPNHTITSLDLNLMALAHAAALEAMSLGGPFGAFHDLFIGMLTTTKQFTWRGNGPGVGRELRRSYSNINGRAFARYYLQNHEGVLGLLPLEGASTWMPGNIEIIKRQGQVGDMPDWVGWTSTGFVVAEAKGTYDGSDWQSKFRFRKLPGCLLKAQEQIARAQINNYGVAIDISYKGWAVGSRWSTEGNGLDPWLVALDPSYGQAVLDNGAFDQVAVNLQREYLRRALIVTGFNPGTLGSKEVSFDFNIPFDNVTTFRSIGAVELTGLVVAVGRSGFSPIRSPAAVEAVALIADTIEVWLVLVITEKLLEAVRDGFLLRASERRSTENLYLHHGIGLIVMRRGEDAGSIQAKQDG